MKSFLTFTLAAGVAISTTSVVQAAGVTNSSAAMASKPSASVLTQGPQTVGGVGFTLDRMALSRELNRLNQLLAPQESTDDGLGADAGMQQKTGQAWSW